MKKILIVVPLLLSFSVLAKDAITEVDSEKFKEIKLEELEGYKGIILKPSGFITPKPSSKDQSARVPASLEDFIDGESSFISHNIILKVPKPFKEFTDLTLKDRASIEKYLLYNSDVALEQENVFSCSPTNGTIKTDMALPKVLQIFDYPEKLECDVKVTNVCSQKPELSDDIRQKLPNLKDSETKLLTLNMKKCNMIFKAVTQNIYFIKASDGNTLIVIENHSVLKKSVLDKLDAVKLLAGSPVKFINGQVKKNMNGLVGYIQERVK